MGTLTGNLSAQQARIVTEAFKRPRKPQAATTLLRLDALKTGQEARITLLIGPRPAEAQEASLRSASDILIRVKELAIQASNGTYNVRTGEPFQRYERLTTSSSSCQYPRCGRNAVFADTRLWAGVGKDASGVVHYLGDSTGVELSVGGNRALNIARPGTIYFGSVPVHEEPRILSDSELESFSVDGSEAAEPGHYSVAVNQLARGQATLSGTFTSGATVLNAGNPLSLTVGQGSGSQVLTINPPTPAAVAEAINDSTLGFPPSFASSTLPLVP